MSEIPPHFAERIRQAKENRLVELDLRSSPFPDKFNQPLTAIPPQVFELEWLEVLKLSWNQLSALPPEISQLSNLTLLVLQDNPLSIPPEILERAREPAVIINFYLQHLQGPKQPLNEAKVLLVGQGAVGKTSLVKRLIQDDFDPRENKTEGIAIQRWALPMNGQQVRLNLWDFGGQEIMHATHQFFLTHRSLYLLVLDARLDEGENRLEYWLKIIASFGGDSPVILVGNKLDQHPLDIDRRTLLAKYPAIKAIVETSCASGQGIEALKAAIAGQVGALPHVHDPLLLTWLSVKSQLEEMEQNYIPYEQYEQVCRQAGITDEYSPDTLVGFLHDLGVVLNFRDDPRLQSTHVLNPEWVTNGVYLLLNARQMDAAKGVLTRDLLKQILSCAEYPAHKHLFIVDMMRKFELCYDFEGYRDRKFLIPDLLPKQAPEVGDWQEALAFQYHYNVLPGSVISRFIVRTHSLQQAAYWRSGVVLAHEGNQALVYADYEERKIFMWVKGAERGRRGLLAIIRSQFEHIHHTIPGIQANEQVPLPDRPEIVVDYKHLLGLEEARVERFYPQGLVPVQEYSVKQLLDGVDLPEREQLVYLRRILSERLNDSELRDLCFDLSVDYDDILGDTKSDKVRELLLDFARRRRIPDLLRVGRQLRKDVPWEGR